LIHGGSKVDWIHAFFSLKMNGLVFGRCTAIALVDRQSLDNRRVLANLGSEQMRTISKRTQYGLKAVIALGQRYGEGPVLIATLAKDEQIPLKFLEGILLDLKSRGLLNSKKGKGGGYQLSRPPSTVTIGSIIRMMEGPLAPLPCASETAFRPCEECQDVEHCSTRIIMREVRDAIAEVLDKTTLADLIRKAEAARQERKSREPLMYYI
jgi:Rrf2 family protein